MDETLYTVSDVAKIIKTNQGYVYKLIRNGLIPALKLGNLKIRRQALCEFLAKYEGKDLTDPEQIKELDLNNLSRRKDD